jgi:ABC-type glycerol-3-phosphate transport system permease component
MKTVQTALLYAFLLVCLVAMAVPFLWMVSGSFKMESEIFRSPPTLIPRRPILANYADLFLERNFLRHFRNSMFLAVTQTLLHVFFCALGGYAFAKYEFRFKNALFLLLLGSMMVPTFTIYVPLFVLVIKLGLIDSYAGVILPGIVSAFGIFLTKQNMESGLPDELLDAARIDGSTEFGTFWRIALPLSRPALAVLAVWSFMASWNGFVWPMIVLRSRELQPVPVILASMVGIYGISYGTVMAGAFLSAVPMIILFVLAQKHFITGLTVGAVRG